MATTMKKLVLVAFAAVATCLTPKAWATGELPGIFSVSATKKVQFSQGNLQAVFASAGNSCAWQFADNQYDYVGYAADNDAVNGNGSVSAAGKVDLFGWSTASTYYGINNSGDAVDYSGDFVDWGNLAISNGGNTENSGWRTLTRDEWAYLFSNHTFGFATVAGVKGVIIAPDNYAGPAIDSNHRNGQDSFANNTIDVSTWQSTYVPAGVVFLPAAGFRIPWIGQVQECGYYWSSSAVGGGSNNKFAILLGLSGTEFQINVGDGGNWPANDGFSVRLVKNVYTISYDANSGNGAPSEQMKYHGIGLTLSSDVPTRAHYTFAGWATSADGDAEYQPGDAYALNADQTLYAKWTDAPQATVAAVPTATGPLFYTGEAQTLINAGTASGGEMQYKLGDGEWSASLPTATAVGDYTVYYKVVGDNGHTDSGVASVAVVIYTLDLSTLTADYEVADGDRLFGETTYNVTVPSGATVRINGIRLTGGAADPVTPEFAEGGEAVTTKFEKGEGDTWKITAWGEIDNDASGTGVADGQIKVYRGDEVDDVTTPVTPTITKKKSAVKVEMTVEAPSGKDSQFFRVDFGE